ncbi:MAG: hypothetical protein JSS30_03365 [Verrucomicrobia bacterium]|nr:hypothetical protein [Verrucomicrobiota bacterium]
MFTKVISTSYSNNQELATEIRKYPILGFSIPFSSRAIVEVAVWRDLKVLDGSLNIGHRVIASGAAAMIAAVALVESVIRTIFSYILLPLMFTEDIGYHPYEAFYLGNKMVMTTIVHATVAVIAFLTEQSVSMKAGNEDTPAYRLEAWRDAYRGEFYEVTHHHLDNTLTYTQIT